MDTWGVENMRISLSTLRDFTTAILTELGAPPGISEEVTESLLRADLTGYGTHGVGILPLYSQMVTDGAIVPNAKPTTEIKGTTASVNGNAGFGQLTGHEATAAGVALAKDEGVGLVGVQNGSHLGPIGEFAEESANQDVIFIGFTNTGGGAKNTAPCGGHRRKLSTNPIAFGFPTFDTLPFNIIADFATSQVSGSVIRNYHRSGEDLHPEWTTTDSGKPVADSAAFMQGEGALLPIGGRVTGHKGYALSVAAELLGGMVGGEAVVGEHEPTWLANGGAFIFIDPTRFVSREVLQQRVSALSTHLRSDTVRLPGEGMHNRRKRNRKRGIELAAYDLVPLAKLASQVGVDIPVQLLDAIENADDVDNEDVKTW